MVTYAYFHTQARLRIRLGERELARLLYHHPLFPPPVLHSAKEMTDGTFNESRFAT